MYLRQAIHHLAEMKEVISTGPLDVVEAEATRPFINVIKSMTFPLSKASQRAQQLPEEVQSHFTSLHAYKIFTYPQQFSRVLFTTRFLHYSIFLFAGQF